MNSTILINEPPLKKQKFPITYIYSDSDEEISDDEIEEEEIKIKRFEFQEMDDEMKDEVKIIFKKAKNNFMYYLNRNKRKDRRIKSFYEGYLMEMERRDNNGYLNFNIEYTSWAYDGYFAHETSNHLYKVTNFVLIPPKTPKGKFKIKSVTMEESSLNLE